MVSLWISTVSCSFENSHTSVDCQIPLKLFDSQCNKTHICVLFHEVYTQFENCETLYFIRSKAQSGFLWSLTYSTFQGKSLWSELIMAREWWEATASRNIVKLDICNQSLCNPVYVLLPDKLVFRFTDKPQSMIRVWTNVDPRFFS